MMCHGRFPPSLNIPDPKTLPPTVGAGRVGEFRVAVPAPGRPFRSGRLANWCPLKVTRIRGIRSGEGLVRTFNLMNGVSQELG
jgi:hypothetical protein